jgi:hypothetical protein
LVKKIFVSMGTPYSPKYSGFRDELEQVLRDTCDADPRIIGKNEYPRGNPLTKIKEVMSGCDGVLVVAYERKFVSKGLEKRNSSDQTALTDAAYTTPWNHIEAAMAFALGIPLYVICEKGLREDGLIETKVDWYVQYLDLDRKTLRSRDVTNHIQNWVAELPVGRIKRSSLIAIISGDVPLSGMTPADYFKAGGVLFATFSLGAAFSSYLLPLLH